jgi:phage gp36-like protein
MPFLTKEDFKTHLYREIIEEITRNDDTIIAKAIKAAISEAKSYLSRYNLVALFGDPNSIPIVEPEVESEHLRNLSIDIACWHLIKLSNPNVNIELFRTGYQDAIKFLEKVMKGQADPEGWPYKADNANTSENENSFVQWSSNRKRSNHF